MLIRLLKLGVLGVLAVFYSVSSVLPCFDIILRQSPQMLKLLVRLLITMAALAGADYLLPNFNLYGGFLRLLWFSIVLGLLNWTVKPVLIFFSVPLVVLTAGFFYLVINAVILYFASILFPNTVTGTMLGFFLGSIFVSIFQWILTVVFRVHKHD